MNVGDVVFYKADADQPDYSIVTSSDDYRPYAYWVREKQVLFFTPSSLCYTKVGPSVLGKW